MSNRHSSILDKLYKSIYADIDLILTIQNDEKRALTKQEADKLVEYAKLFRADKDDIDVSKLSDEELDRLLQDTLEKGKSK